jgi:hypothetical protein
MTCCQQQQRQASEAGRRVGGHRRVNRQQSRRGGFRVAAGLRVWGNTIAISGLGSLGGGCCRWLSLPVLFGAKAVRLGEDWEFLGELQRKVSQGWCFQDDIAWQGDSGPCWGQQSHHDRSIISDLSNPTGVSFTHVESVDPAWVVYSCLAIFEDFNGVSRIWPITANYGLVLKLNGLFWLLEPRRGAIGWLTLQSVDRVFVKEFMISFRNIKQTVNLTWGCGPGFWKAIRIWNLTGVMYVCFF